MFFSTREQDKGTWRARGQPLPFIGALVVWDSERLWCLSFLQFILFEEDKMVLSFLFFPLSNAKTLACPFISCLLLRSINSPPKPLKTPKKNKKKSSLPPTHTNALQDVPVFILPSPPPPWSVESKYIQNCSLI